MERLTALALASGVLLTSSMGSLHDPHCPHHPGSADHEAWVGAVALDVGGTDEHAGHASSHGAPSGDQAPEDCTCEGGLCVLSAVVGPPAVAAAEISVGDARPTGSRPTVVAVMAGTPDRYLQPPGTGPPAIV